MNKLHLYRAEHNLLNTVLQQRGGSYQASSQSEARTFARRCNEFRKRFRETVGGVSPYDDIVISVQQGSPLVSFKFRPSVPEGTFTAPDGTPIPIADEVGAGSPAVRAAPAPTLELDLSDLGIVPSETGPMFDDTDEGA